MSHPLALCIATALALAAAGCAPSYSPKTYSADAMQQANKVDQAVVVGVREVGVSADGAAGAVVGGAAGGLIGSQVPGSSLGTAFGVLGGSLVGGLVGTATEHGTEDTTAYEYIVREANGTLLSVAQRDRVPLAIGTHVLVIAGKQARIVPDYTVAVAPPPVPMPASLPADPSLAQAAAVAVPQPPPPAVLPAVIQTPLPAPK